MARIGVNNYKNGGKLKKRRRAPGPRPEYMNQNPPGMENGPFSQPNGMEFGLGGTLGGILGAAAGSLIPIPGVGTALGAQLGSTIGGQFDKPQAQVPYGATPPINPYYNGRLKKGGRVMCADGGQISGIPINVEGYGMQEGSMAQMKKGELLAKGGKIYKNYISRPPHPKEGTNPYGDATEEEGMIVVPKNRSNEYLNASKKNRNMIEDALVSQQEDRDRLPEMDMTFKRGGAIHIKPQNRGKFTKWAKSHNMGVQEAASHIMANKGNYNSQLIKRANFAKNAANFKHAEGGGVGTLEDYGTDPSIFARNYMQGTAYPAQAGGLGIPPEAYGEIPLAPASKMPGNTVPEWGNPTQVQEPNVNPYASNTEQTPTNWRQMAQGVGMFAAPAYNIGVGLFGKTAELNPKDYMVNTDLEFDPLSDRESMRQIRTGYNTGYNRLKNSGLYSQSGQIALASQRMGQEAASRERIGNINAEGKFNSKRAKLARDTENARTKFNVTDYNQRSLDAQKDMLGLGIGQLGEIAQGTRNDDIAIDALDYYHNDPYNQNYYESRFPQVRRRANKYYKKK